MLRIAAHIKKKSAARLKELPTPVAALVTGEALISVGLWMAWPPLAPIVLGVQVVALALLRETPS